MFYVGDCIGSTLLCVVTNVKVATKQRITDGITTTTPVATTMGCCGGIRRRVEKDENQVR